jgi:DNA mismatch repair protein MutS2
MEAGGVVMISTHHDALKVFAQRTASVVNAAMEFDPVTLAPTYRLKVGRPGRSNALEIASRLGLRADIVERARELVADDAVELDDVLRNLESQERALEKERGALGGRIAELEAEAATATAAHAEQMEAYQSAERAAREAVDKAVRELRARGEERLSAMEDKAPAVSDRARSDRRAGLGAVTGELRRQAIDTLAEAKTHAPRSTQQRLPVGGPAAAADPPTRPLLRGGSVRVETFGATGTILRDWNIESGGKVEVDVGGKRIVVAREDLTATAPASKPVARAPQTYRRLPDVSDELDLHGMRVDEALSAVDKHIDDAILAELCSVRFIHGFGTLRLRDAIREHLRGRPEVAAFAAADPFSGGEGVTVVRLED